MKNLEAISIRHIDGRLELLDEQMLPNKEEWVWIQDPNDMIAAIKALKVRGAPLIGVAAALSLAQYAEGGANKEEFLQAAEGLRASRPTAVNLMWALDQLIDFEGGEFDSKTVVQKAEMIFDEDVSLCHRIAEHGAVLIEDGDSILTHCNTGGLATAGIGTALGVIQKAHEQGKRIHVFVDETRPLLQGGRLTTWELKKRGIPYTLICDNMAASLMSAGKINKAIVGSDRIAANGDFANKIGTFNVAVLCHYHRIPFYVAAPYSTVDLECPNGQSIPIEERRPEEVRGVMGSFGEVQWSPTESPVYNPAFDVTPAGLTTRWILDKGVFDQTQIEQGALKAR